LAEQRESFSDSREQSSLPGVSKHSIERSLEESAQLSPEVKRTFTKPEPADHADIEPASHKNIPKSATNIAKDLKEHFSEEKNGSRDDKYSHNAYTPNGSKLGLPRPPQQAHDAGILPVESSELKIRKHPKESERRDFEQELEGEYEQNTEINKPKVLKNSMGAYKLRTSNLPAEKPAQAEGGRELRASRASSRQGSRIDFAESQVEQLQQEEDDIIMMPETDPLELSFHEAAEEGRGVKELSFRKCFEADKYLLGADRRQKMFWLANDTLNLVRPSSKRRSGKKESYCVPELLQERERKFGEELRYVEEQKDRKIQELEHRLRSLQSETLNMKEKIVEQDREIRLIKTASEADSRLNHHNYLEDQNFLFKQKLSSAHRSHKDRSFLDDPTPKQARCLDPEGRLINARHFAPHLAPLASDKQKKLLLKNKELLLKNDDIEIGCMSKHNGQVLVVTFYITPETDVSMTYSIESGDDCL
jgi:hypothetical protein